jgi:hypothetical protein
MINPRISFVLTTLSWAAPHVVTFVWDSSDPVYVRGDFTSPPWELFDELKITKPDNKVTVSLQPGTYHFRFFTPNEMWHEVEKDMKIVEGAVDIYELVDNGLGGKNIRIEVAHLDLDSNHQLAAVPLDLITKMVSHTSARSHILKYLSDRDLRSFRSVTKILGKVASFYVSDYKQLKLDIILSRQFMENPESLKDYVDARIDSWKRLLHLQLQVNTVEEVDRIIAKEREFAAIALTLPKVMWRSVETVKEVVKKVEGKKKELNLQFIVGDSEDVLSAYAVIASAGLEGNVVLVGELEFVSLSKTLVKDLRPLSGLVKLKELYLCNTHVKDLTPLSGLVKLEWLSLDNTEMNDLALLSGLDKLEWLNLANTQVKDISLLSGLVNLEYLSLEDTQVKDLRPLRSLVKLERLKLGNTQVTDLTPLSGLVKLEYLYLQNTPVALDLALAPNIAELKTYKRGCLLSVIT